MIPIPPRAVRGQILTADQWNAVIDCLRRLNPIAGQGIRIRETAQGVVLDSAAVATAVQRQEEAKIEAPAPFTLRQFGTDEQTGKPKWGLYAGSLWECFKFIPGDGDDGRTVRDDALLTPEESVTGREKLMLDEYPFWDVSAEVNKVLSETDDAITYFYAERSLAAWPQGSTTTPPTYKLVATKTDPYSEWRHLFKECIFYKNASTLDGDRDLRAYIAKVRTKVVEKTVTDEEGKTETVKEPTYKVEQILKTDIQEDAKEVVARVYQLKDPDSRAPENMTDVSGKTVEEDAEYKMFLLYARILTLNGSTLNAQLDMEMAKAFAICREYDVVLHSVDHLPGVVAQQEA